VVFLEAIVTGNQGVMLPTATQNLSTEHLLDGSINEQDITKVTKSYVIFVFFFVLWPQILRLKLKLIFLLNVNVVCLYGSTTGRVTVTRRRPKNTRAVPVYDLCTKRLLQSWCGDVNEN
jgi:hypothetical protein